MSSFYWLLSNCFSVSNHPSLFHSPCWGWDSFPQTSFLLCQLLPVRLCPYRAPESDLQGCRRKGDVKLLFSFLCLSASAQQHFLALVAAAHSSLRWKSPSQWQQWVNHVVFLTPTEPDAWCCPPSATPAQPPGTASREAHTQALQGPSSSLLSFKKSSLFLWFPQPRSGSCFLHHHLRDF